MEFVFSSLTYLLLFVLTAILLFLIRDEVKTKSLDEDINEGLREPPAPKSWPIIGHLYLMARHKVPYRVFGEIMVDLGAVFRLDLGTVPCVVINGLQNIREVLMVKGDHFDSRPSFRRFNQLFKGDKNNSLAFCDWSQLQKSRRELLRAHTFPHAASNMYNRLDKCVKTELTDLLDTIDALNDTSCVNLKYLLLHSCANMFMSYFCSARFTKSYDRFREFVRNFDEVFYEVNIGSAGDFLPWLKPLYHWHFKKLRSWSASIRKFMISEIFEQRRTAWKNESKPVDFVDSILEACSQSDRDDGFNADVGLFALEDIIGGHSAITNFIVKALGFLVERPDVQKRIQEEADAVTLVSGNIGLAERCQMPYTEAVVYETIRLIASPIVPHMANKDTSIAGMKISKGTTVFINNYDLNMSPELWENPEHFNPERFINEEGRLEKPDYFLPFSGGKRSCMGYKLVQLISYCTIATLLQKYSLLPVEDVSYSVPKGNLALPYVTFPFQLRKRTTEQLK
ncbi:cytochrome P450 307a1-like [Daktulosphaira vitifoliae]|uniref:cytochrome P450 307a1-like n=1 Tax=Daktulosphaira vitifoliae TaxID=58002 RepID=UPI0021A9F241|nr:cytochrome P450 307a1-like [Daktulosphaira vitifoliae]